MRRAEINHQLKPQSGSWQQPEEEVVRAVPFSIKRRERTLFSGGASSQATYTAMLRLLLAALLLLGEFVTARHRAHKRAGGYMRRKKHGNEKAPGALGLHTTQCHLHKQKT
jgi:hypothetical protein